MIRQDTTRPPDRRLPPGLRTGELDGKLIRWFVKQPTPSMNQEGRGPDRFRRKPARIDGLGVGG